MYTATLQWRAEVKLEQLYSETFDWPKARKAFRQHYPTYYHKEDKAGSPIHIHELDKLNIDKVSTDWLRSWDPLLHPADIDISYARHSARKRPCSTSTS